MEGFLSFNYNELTAIKLSLKVALCSILITLPFGILCGYVLARFSFRGKILLDSIVNLPLILPPVITGYLLLLTFGKNGYIGKYLYDLFNISFAFNWKGAVLASAVVSFPLMVRAIRVAIEQVDPSYEKVAATLGASKLKVFVTITIPLAMNGIIAGTVTAFARSLGEFGATITFVSNIPGKTNTIPIEIYSLIQNPSSDEASIIKLVVISVAIAFLSLMLSELFVRRTTAYSKDR